METSSHSNRRWRPASNVNTQRDLQRSVPSDEQQIPPHDDSDVQAEERRGGLRRLVTCCLMWDHCFILSSLIAVGIGFAAGFALYYSGAPSSALVWVGLPGELWMQMLKAVVLPLIISSIITGTAGLKPKDNGRVTGVALSYIIATNVMGAIFGTVLAVAIKPGVRDTGTVDTSTKVQTDHLETADLFADLIRNLVPDNVVTACFEKVQTRYRPKSIRPGSNITQYERYLGTSSGTNILGLVIVSTSLGMAAAQMEEVARPFLKFFQSTAEVLVRLIQWIVWMTPVGAASLIAKAVGGTQDVEATFRGLGFFVLAETSGILALTIVLSIIYVIFLRQNPLPFVASTSRAITAGFASASSIVAMPEIIRCVEDRHKIDPRISRFVVPLAVALNRDGSALFIAMTSLYIAQVNGVAHVGTAVMITILSAIGSLAIPGVPSASIVTILMICASLDIQPANVGIIIALEWYSDRLRAIPNMLSHCVCAVLTWQFCRSSLLPEVDQVRQSKAETSRNSNRESFSETNI
ncbi:excitatory amino acid transporter-like [Pomacea canaliculata]|uniref:excitatory amino acid transporter-like n=1 Tax=Pomacea canaliculata TaxID=400727 RepID=UPI000D7340B8|nr:excitatory amino acid transporter-like [Pomacea canaliculata]